jgi:hypothetical protein
LSGNSAFGFAAELDHGAVQRFDVLRLLGAELLQHGEFFALEETTLDHFFVERSLQVLQGQRVVQDADVPFSELFGFRPLTVVHRFGFFGAAHRRRAASATATGSQECGQRRSSSDRDEFPSRYRVHVRLLLGYAS